MDTILTITGSDNTGGSGVQADIRAITELGGRMVSVVTCITIQNTLGIQEFYDIPAQVVADQIEAIGNDMQPPSSRLEWCAISRLYRSSSTTSADTSLHTLSMTPSSFPVTATC